MAQSRPRLLFVSHRLPYPPHNGAAIRAYNVLRLLARHYDVTAVCFDRHDKATAGIPIESRLAALSELGTFTSAPIPQEQSRTRLAWDHLRSVVSGRPYTYYLHDARTFTQRLERLLRDEPFDLVHVESIDLVRYLDVVPLERTILTHHNVESLLLERRAGAEASPLRRAYLGHQARLVRNAEAQWVPQVAMNVAVSSFDADELRRIAPNASFAVVPNGVDVDYFAPTARSRQGMVFVGGTSYYPNLDALRWLAAELVPLLRAEGVRQEVTVVGRATPEEIAAFGGNGITLTGYVEDVRPVLDAAACFVAPLRVGGGTRLKLLDAWAMGKAIVSTRIGAEGLVTRDGDNILLADEPAAFVGAVRRVLEDATLRARLEVGARRTAVQTYSWDVIERDMIAAYEGVRARATGRRAAAHSA